MVKTVTTRKSAAYRARAKRLRERQRRWQTISEVFDKPYAERSEAERGVTVSGICLVAQKTFEPGIYFKMRAALNGFMSRTEGLSFSAFLGPTRGRWGGPGDEYDEWDAIRAQLCAFFAVLGCADRELFFDGVKA